MTKTLTSAVDKMTVAEVRRCLAELRSMWINSTSEKVFDANRPSGFDMSTEEFCFKFVKGHHEKRKRKKTNGTCR